MSKRHRRVDQAPAETSAFDSVRRDLLTIANCWVMLEEFLSGGAGIGQAGGKKPKPSARIPISADIADARQKIALWVHFLARVLMEEVTVESVVPTPWADAGRTDVMPWSPPTLDTGNLLRYIAEHHIGHFLYHNDPMIARDFIADAKQLARFARGKALPTGARWIPLGVPCPEVVELIPEDVVHEGVREPCAGRYRMWMVPDQGMLGDLVCDRDPGHTITPSEWQRAQRRRPTNPEAAARFARTLRLAGRKAS